MADKRIRTNAHSYEDITVAATAIGITASLLNFDDNNARMTEAFFSLETAQIRWRADGTNPTSSVGHLLEIGQTLELEGSESLSKFRAIRTGSTSGALKVTLER